MRVSNIQTFTEGSGIPNSYRYRNTGNSDGSYHIGDLDDIALSDRTYRENGQKIYTDNFGLTRQDTENSVQRDYVVDYTSAIKNDLMVYEDGGFKTSYTYGANGRISQMTRPLSEEINPVTGKVISTTADAKGENVSTNIAVEKLGKLYYHLDRLGSTAFITDESGMVRSYATYDEWGNVREGGSHDVNIASIDATAGFTTYTYDKVLDKYFAQYRMYDAENRRFTAEDPIKDGVNWYNYVGNRPLTVTDPMGLETVESSFENQMDMKQRAMEPKPGDLLINGYPIRNVQEINGNIYGDLESVVAAFNGTVTTTRHKSNITYEIGAESFSYPNPAYKERDTGASYFVKINDYYFETTNRIGSGSRERAWVLYEHSPWDFEDTYYTTNDNRQALIDLNEMIHLFGKDATVGYYLGEYGGTLHLPSQTVTFAPVQLDIVLPVEYGGGLTSRARMEWWAAGFANAGSITVQPAIPVLYDPINTSIVHAN